MPDLPSLDIALMLAEDIPLLHAAAGSHVLESDYFETAFTEQNDGKRHVLIARRNGMICGYVHLNYFPRYTLFRRLSIPEFQDLYVLPEFRRNGVAQALIAACEKLAREHGATEIGLGVGVGGDFGPAQRLYVQCGYVPDGFGAVFEREPISVGEVRPIDDRICLMLLKSLE